MATSNCQVRKNKIKGGLLVAFFCFRATVMDDPALGLDKLGVYLVTCVFVLCI